MSEGYWSRNGKYVPAPPVNYNPSTGSATTQGYYNGAGKYVPGMKL